MVVVEQPALVEDRPFRRVQIFGLHIPQCAPAEADRAAARIVDGEHQPAAKTVVAALRRFPGEARLQQLLRLQAREFRAHRIRKRVARTGRKTQAELRLQGRGHRAPLQIGAGLCSADRLQLAPKPVPRGLHQLVEACASLALGIVAAQLGNRQPHFGCKRLHRLHEGQAVLLHHEADRVAVRAAAEAMVEALLLVHVKTGRLLVVEGAAALQLAARTCQLHPPPDDARKPHPGAQIIQEFGRQAHG